MLRSSLCVAGVALFAASATAQQDASSRLHSITSPVKRVTYDVSTGTVRPQKGPSVFFGPDILYNNTCDTGFYAGMSPTERFSDNGQLPGTDNGQLPGCASGVLSSYKINGWTIGYCADRASIDLAQNFHQSHDNCTGQSSLTPTATFAVTGLPGNGTGGVLCWILTFDLMGGSGEFSMVSDGDGVWDGTGAIDTFGTSYELTNITGTASGIILAGNPVFLNMGCDFAVNTVFSLGDPTGSSPQGTGYGSTDSFGLEDGTGYLGCFFFGGWPANPWSSYYLQLYTDDAQCGTGQITTPVCGQDAGGSCPCTLGGSPNDPVGVDEGCVNSSGVGSLLEGGAGSGTSVSGEDFTLRGHQLPAAQNMLYFAGTALGGGISIYSGVNCMGGSTNRVDGGYTTGTGDVTSPMGATSITTVGNALAPGYFAPGTYYFQIWHRDLLSCDNGPLPPLNFGEFANFGGGAGVTLTL
jgi:hypothetical protein